MKTTISYSELSKFLVCQQAWYIEYIEKIRRPNAAMLFGSIFHAVLEASYKNKSRAITEKKYNNIVAGVVENKEWEGVEIDVSHTSDRVWALFQEYRDFYDSDQDIEVVGTEVMVERGPLRGKVDLKYMQKKRLWLMEHKTKAQFLRQPYDWQSHIYSYLVPEAYGIVYNQIKSYDYKNPTAPSNLFSRVPLFVSRNAEETLLYHVNRALQEMNLILEGKEKPMATFVSYICGMCSDKADCPAFLE